MSRKQALSSIRDGLREPSASIWTDADLFKKMDLVMLEIARKEPLKAKADLPITERTKDVDISSISRIVDIKAIEFPVYQTGGYLRKFSRYGNNLSMVLDGVPRILQGNLTGTLTFTKGSRTVTGSGTAFTSELVSNDGSGDGYLISPATRLYKVAYITSDTSLILDEIYEEETVTGAAIYRDPKSCVRLHYGKQYTLTNSAPVQNGYGLDDLTVTGNYTGTGVLSFKVQITSASTTDVFKWSKDGGATWTTGVSCTAGTPIHLSDGLTITFAAATGHTLNDYWTFEARPSDLPQDVINTLILGVVAKAATEYAANYLQLKMTDITSKIGSASTAAGNIAARITQALLDIASNRTNLATNLTGYTNTLADVETALDAVETDLASGRALINTSNPGGDVAGKYANSATVKVQEAKGRLDKALSYLQAATTNEDYVKLATAELSGAAASVSQADSYIKMIEQEVNVALLAREYKGWANKMAKDYEDALACLGQMDDSFKGPFSTSLP